MTTTTNNSSTTSRNATSATSRSDYAAEALAYAQDIVAGRIVSCKWVFLACRRHLRDLERAAANDPKFPYVFDADRAAEPCRFIEALPHTKGDWARKAQRITLERWQKFVLAVIFGWINRDDGTRRFRVAYVAIPRKNGKSILAAGIGLFMFAGDGEHGAEVYAGATDEDQAWEVYRPAKQMVERTPKLQAAFGVSITSPKKNSGHGAMQILANGSRFETMVGKPGDGASPSCSIHDEYHEHKTPDQVDAMRTGMGARLQPLQLIITTAGYTIGGPCHSMQRDVEQMLEGTIELEHTFGIVYTVDRGDDWTSDAALVKANPNYGVSVYKKYLEEQLADALSSARKQAVFKTKHLNIWVNAKSGWMNMELWNRLADPSLHEDLFAGESAWLGLDLASVWDIASKAKIFVRVIDGLEHYYIFTRNFLPERTVDLPEKRHYQEWAAEGHLVVTPGEIIDHDYIERDIVADSAAHQVEDIGFDKYNATDLVKRLGETHGLTCTEVPQTIEHFNQPMKWLEGLVLSGRIHHDGNKVLAFAMSNVIALEDGNGNIKPTKERGEIGLAKKIDPAVAAMMAIARRMKAEVAAGPPGILLLSAATRSKPKPNPPGN